MGARTGDRMRRIRRFFLCPRGPNTNTENSTMKIVLAYSGGLDTSVIVKVAQRNP